MAIIQKIPKPGDFDSRKVAHTNTPDLLSNFVGAESFVWLNSHIFALYKTSSLDSVDSIECSNFLGRIHLPFIQRDSVTHMHGLAVSVKERRTSACVYYLESSDHFYLCFRLSSLFVFFFLGCSLSFLCENLAQPLSRCRRL